MAAMGAVNSVLTVNDDISDDNGDGMSQSRAVSSQMNC